MKNIHVLPTDKSKQEVLEEVAKRLYPEEWDWREREINMINYFDVIYCAAIIPELSIRSTDVKSIINIETKKKYFRVWYKQFKEE